MLPGQQLDQGRGTTACRDMRENREGFLIAQQLAFFADAVVRKGDERVEPMHCSYECEQQVLK